MSDKVKDIDTKNHTRYFFDYIINIKNFDPSNIKVDEKSYESILIYYIGYVTIKDSKYIKITTVNPIFLIFRKVNRNFEEINKSRYLMLVSTNESKEKKIMKNWEKN